MKAVRSLRRQLGYIYLRTGGNGSCKTLFTLRDVRDMQLKESRPVYFVKGRFEALPILTEEFGWVPIDFKEWEGCEDGAIILADEVHYDLPKRSPSAAVPPHIAHLSEHRKRGFDFFMLTQHPMNIDDFVRRLVQAPGYHEHFKRILGGTNATSVLRWDAVNPQCEKDGSGKTAQIERRTHPKEVYNWYKSATLHTAKVRIPKQVYTLVGCLIGFIVVAYMLVQKFMPKDAPEKPKAAATTPADPLQIGGGSSAAERKPLTPAEYVAAYNPRVPGLMHTAPAYDRLTEPKRVPIPAACIESKAQGCKCYTQDATPYPVDLAMCRQLVAHGAFLAFQPEGEQKQQQQTRTEAPARPEIAPQAASGLIHIGDAAPARAAAPAPQEQQPQRIASVKR